MNNVERYRLLSVQAKKNVLMRYALLQIPDLLVLLLVLFLLGRWGNISFGMICFVAVLWILKDIVLFPFVWPAFEAIPPDARQALIGAEGVAVEHVAPCGYVRVHGVLWRAQRREDWDAIEKGDKVMITGIVGLTLTVRRKT